MTSPFSASMGAVARSSSQNLHSRKQLCVMSLSEKISSKSFVWMGDPCEACLYIQHNGVIISCPWITKTHNLDSRVINNPHIVDSNAFSHWLPWVRPTCSFSITYTRYVGCATEVHSCKQASCLDLTCGSGASRSARNSKLMATIYFRTCFNAGNSTLLTAQVL